MPDPEAFLRRQSLAGRSDLSVEELIEAVAGLNAQTTRGPIVGLWTRLADLSLAELDAGLRDYRLVKANLFRGTVHLVTRRQYLTWRLALQPMLERVTRGFCPGLWQQVDHDHLLAAGIELLRERPGLTRTEISDALAPSFPGPESRWLGFAIRMLLPVVQLADESAWTPGRTRYLLAEQAIGHPSPDTTAGTADALHSFLRAYGPRPAADATYWSGLTRLAPVLADVADRRDGQAYDVDPIIDEPPRRTFVLPEFDNLYFCTRDTTIALIEAKQRLVHGGAMPGSLITNGEVRGTWTAAGGHPPELRPWSPPDEEEQTEFTRFRNWWQSP